MANKWVPFPVKTFGTFNDLLCVINLQVKWERAAIFNINPLVNLLIHARFMWFSNSINFQFIITIGLQLLINQ